VSSSFPKGFFFGAATSAHQVEGGNHNDWTEWEKENAERLAKEAAKKSWPDFILKNYPNPLQKENYISGKACDHYNRFEEDFDLAKKLGHNAHRFSIEWSRIEPLEGRFNEKEIQHYRQVIRALRKRNIEPFVTLWHWTLPLWVRNIGGWENKRVISYFSRYAERIIQEYRDTVRFWIPINEPEFYVGLGYTLGVQPPAVKNIFRANVALRNLAAAQRSVYKIIHETQPSAEVGVAQATNHMFPYKDLLSNKIFVKILEYVQNRRFLNHIGGAYDFIGIQYYQSLFVNFKFGNGQWGLEKISPPQDQASDLDWFIYPEGVYRMLKLMARYKKPIYITENGIADSRDIKRADFIREHLVWIQRALREGVDVKGYLYWSLLDNFEMPRLDGFWPRFGLVEVDYSARGGSASGGKTLKRKIRPSALTYKKMIAEALRT